MRIGFDPEDLRFQQTVRDWIEVNYPADVRAKITRSPHARADRDDHIRWQQALHRQGWLVPHWPEAYGGQGWSPQRLYLFRAAMSDAQTPDLPGSGVELLGPVLLRFGTPRQLERYLDDLLWARTWWTQGFSEPNAGSDLASLQTRAERRGDRYIVNGSKIWTTNAHRADRMFALVRTSHGSKRGGISFLLLDMKAPGVEVRPIVTLDEAPPGLHEVNEVFFQDVEVPVDDRLGDEGEGWACAKYLLEFERARPVVLAVGLRRHLQDVAALARRWPEDAPAARRPDWRDRFARLAVDVEVLMWSELRLHAELSRGQSPGHQGSMLKTLETEYHQRVDELLLDIGGLESLAVVQPHDTPRAGLPPEITVAGAAFFNSRKRTIYAGTNEIQRNIIARLTLGLP